MHMEWRFCGPIATSTAIHPWGNSTPVRHRSLLSVQILPADISRLKNASSHLGESLLGFSQRQQWFQRLNGAHVTSGCWSALTAGNQRARPLAATVRPPFPDLRHSGTKPGTPSEMTDISSVDDARAIFAVGSLMRISLSQTTTEFTNNRRQALRNAGSSLAAGLSSEVAAEKTGISQAVGTRLFRIAGGLAPSMFSASSKPLPGRYLGFAEREEVAVLRARDVSMQQIARHLGRAPWETRCRTRRSRWCGR
jgi:hypothetical protein